jgi:uncharacterized protein (TIGR02268 family)
VLEVHVARGVLTNLVFDMPLDESSMELENRVSRFKRAAVAEDLISVEPSVELGPEERLGLRARLKDGTLVSLVLTSHPTQVDGRVDVERPRSREALLAELAQKEAELSVLRTRAVAVGPVGWVFAGLLDHKGVRTTRFFGKVSPDSQSGLKLEGGVCHRAKAWALVTMQVQNIPGQKPWAPGRARVYGAVRLEMKVLGVHPAKPLLAPGESSLLIVELGELPSAAGKVLRLELVDKDGGRPLHVDGVECPGEAT